MKVALLGLGNILRRDDGYGPALAHYVTESMEFGPEVEVTEVGTPGIDLTPYLSGASHVLFLDTVHLDDSPGSLHELSKEDLIKAFEKRPQPISGHQSDIASALWRADWEDGDSRKVCMLAAVPEVLGEGPGLSPRLRESIPEGLRRAKDLLSRWEISWKNKEVEVKAPWWY